jgi:hypothetical protein
MLAAHVGDSVVGSFSGGVDYGWWQEYLSQATGLGTTFVPAIIGFGAVLHNLSDLLDNVPLATTIAGAVGAWVVIWSFLSGGIIDRLARDRATRASGFFGAAGAHFPALARLGLLALIVYAALFRWVHPLLLGDFYERVIRDTTEERRAFGIRLLLYVAFALILALVNLTIDYARIRIVVEDRRSALGAVIASLRFVRRQAGTVWLLYFLNGGLFIVLIGAYRIVANGAAPGGAPVYTLLVGELYVLGRHFLKLVFYASETALFQSRLAHAGYTAAPPILWPESPAAESIANAEPGHP